MLNSHIAISRICDLKANPGNARKHDRKQIRQIVDSIKRFGFNNPVLISGGGQIICGHGRVEAAKLLGLEEVPTVSLDHLSPDELRAYALADNRIALGASWDNELLGIELQHLIEIDFDISLTGFSTTEIDLTLGEAGAAADDPADEPMTEIDLPPVTRPGDVWILGQHRLICGDAQNPGVIAKLLEGGEVADLVFTDPPYNVPIQGHVSGLGKHKHREFSFASGEMSSDEFTGFLATTLCIAAANLKDGGIAYVFMDWRHMDELRLAGELAFDELKQLCVWNKSNAGLGTFYRSKHELIFVYKVGTAPHTNNFGLGDGGRYRTNVWDYPGMSSMSASRDADLAMHPTVKPVQLVQDAILDCSNRGDIVLDIFGGSGTTLIAAERVGRKARLVEFDALYCDTIIRRFEKVTGKRATLGPAGPEFGVLSAVVTPALEDA